LDRNIIIRTILAFKSTNLGDSYNSTTQTYAKLNPWVLGWNADHLKLE